MKKHFLSLLFALFALATFGQTQDSLWIAEHYQKIERMVPMRDGVKLFTSIYVPKDLTEQHPLLIMRTPYATFPYGENLFSSRYLLGHYRYYMRENYIIVQQDVRGKWMSEGNFVDVRPFIPEKKGNEIDESTDTYDLIDYLIKSVPNNNGRAGVWGISYPGFYATMAALSNHPALKAVSPQAPVTEWFIGDDWHHNGALMLMDGFGFYASGFGKPRPAPTAKGPQGAHIPGEDSYDFYLKVGAIKHLNERYLHDSIGFWKELFDHPNYDSWWQARNPRNYVSIIKPATLVVGGLFDAEDCYGAWRLYEAIEKKAKNDNRIVMGPWSHGQWGSPDGTHMGNIRFGSNTAMWYQNNIEIPFFNYHLKGKGSLQDIAEANIFFSGENQWHQFSQWPPKEKGDKPIYLQANGKLAWSKPATTNSSTSYVSDPAKPVPFAEDVQRGRQNGYINDDQRFASRRTDVLTFETEVLTEDLTLAGTVVADLVASTSGTDADFVVKVIDVFPDDFTYQPASQYPMGGYQMMVRGEVMRGRFRNSFEKPEAFISEKPTKVRFEMPDVAHQFKKGHKLMIQIQSSWFPLVDRNPQKFVNIYTADDSDYQKATIRIFHDSKNASAILLPVLQP